MYQQDMFLSIFKVLTILFDVEYEKCSFCQPWYIFSTLLYMSYVDPVYNQFRDEL